MGLTAKRITRGAGSPGYLQSSIGMALAVLASVACWATPSAGESAAQSYFPPSGLAEFLVHSLDLSTLRSSLGPRRSISQRTFATLGIAPTQTGPDDVVMESDEWYYALLVLRRADINGDGLEDLEVCFTDRAKGGTYSARQSLLVTRYSPSAGHRRMGSSAAITALRSAIGRY